MLTTKELVQVLNVSRMTIYRLREEGMPYIQAGYRTLRFDLEKVLEWLNEFKKK